MIILVNMTGGLHMAYNYTSMMVAFCVSLSVLVSFLLNLIKYTMFGSSEIAWNIRHTALSASTL